MSNHFKPKKNAPEQTTPEALPGTPVNEVEGSIFLVLAHAPTGDGTFNALEKADAQQRALAAANPDTSYGVFEMRRLPTDDVAARIEEGK